ncbi:MAG: hypothetical protein WD851_06735 [Pirellulales bacterium]
MSLGFALQAMPGWLSLFAMCWMLGIARHPSTTVLALCIAFAIPLEEMLGWYSIDEAIFGTSVPNPQWRWVAFCILAGCLAAGCWWLGHFRSKRVRRVLETFSARRPKLTTALVMTGALLILGLSALGWGSLNYVPEY